MKTPNYRNHLAVFGNFSGRQQSRTEWVAHQVNKTGMDELLARLAPELTVQLELPGIPDKTLNLVFAEPDDITEAGVLRQIPLIGQIEQLRAALEQAGSEAIVLPEIGSMENLVEVAEANGESKDEAIDLLSMVDIGGEEPEDRLELGLVHQLLCGLGVEAREYPRLKAQLNTLSGHITEQLRKHEGLNRLRGIWQGLRLLVEVLPEQVCLKIVDVTREDHCDATWELFLQPEQGQPQPIDLAIYCEPLAHDEADRHILYHLGRMAVGLHLPMILEADVALLGFRAWHLLAHAREVSHRLNGPDYIKWRKLRDEPGAQWQFLAANPLKLEEGPVIPASLVVALFVVQSQHEAGQWPAELLGSQLELAAQTAASFSEPLAEDMAYNGILPLGRGDQGTTRLLGMTSFARITTRQTQIDAATLVPYTLSYRYYAGCCARALQRGLGELETFRSFAALQDEDALVVEKSENGQTLRIKPRFTILGVQPDLILDM